MDEAGAAEGQDEDEGAEPTESGDGSVRIFENYHCHIDRLADGRFRVYSDTQDREVGVVAADRLDRAHALANRVAGPPRKARR